jgi:DNA excision repair protein ERCC-2
MIQWDDPQRTVQLAVQDLLDRVTIEGGLGPLASSPQARARLGQRAHQRWQREREDSEPDFQREQSVRHVMVVRGWTCVITGRIDGLSREGGQLVVEELKSTMLDAQQLESVRREQLREWCQQLQLYMYFLSCRGELVTGRLVLVSLVDGWRQVVRVPLESELGLGLRERLEWMVAAREDLLAHRRHRSSGPIPFAHDGFRPGQESIASACERVLERGQHLLLSAPTGVGKTAAVLQGALRAAYRQDRRLFYATARTTQQRLVLETLAAMRERGLVVRALGLRAKGRSCLMPEQDCHPERCPYAADLPAKLRTPELLDELLSQGILWPERIQEVAEGAGICPFDLSLELGDRCDVVVGDYNYAFDPSVMPRRWFGEREQGSWMVAVDEAHHLPERARGWLSPSLDGRLVAQARLELEALGSPFTGQLELLEDLLELIEDAGLGVDAAFHDGSSLVAVDGTSLAQLRERADELALDYAIGLQRRWRQGLSLPRSGGEAGGFDPYRRVCWELVRFVARYGEAGEETVGLYTPRVGAPGSLSLFCRDPSAYLGPLLQRLGGGVSLSGTLEPMDQHRAMLGLTQAACDQLRIASPFDPGRQATIIAQRVSTRLRHRERDRAATAEIVERVVAAIPGNCAVLFSSFEMRDRVLELLELPGRARLLQRPEMGEAARRALLDRLASPEPLPRVLLGVTGGIFAEGVDLPGEALLGMVVVGPALPVVSPEQQLMRDWYQRRLGQGYQLAYLLPGMTRVVQAAGRVIRTERDRGVVVLVGQRFVQHDFQAFFPPHWQPVRSSKPWDEVQAFFEADQHG